MHNISANLSGSALAFRHRCEGPFFRQLMLAGIRLIPRWLQRLTMPLWGALFYLLLGRARRAVLGNLEALLGPAGFWVTHGRGLELFRRYAQMISDTYQAYLGRPLQIEVASIGRTPELLQILREHGGILATGHLGMWQVGPLLHGWQELPPFYMARAEEPNPLVQKWEQQFQQRFRVIYTTSSPFSVLSLAKVLRERAVVGMQIDRVIGDHWHMVTICSKRARFPLGPALLARMTGVPLIPSFFVLDREGGSERLLHQVGPLIWVRNSADRDADIRDATEQLASVYERIIKRYPTQFYQFFDFFESAEQPSQNDKVT